ncbi:MAG: DDE-type integrase/transposase/recombinase [Acutalibacter muris]|nr:DDE-type integrase/transposase/recombinase [Acutalibacter muris]
MTWLSTKETALLCNVSESAIQKAVKQGRYEHCYVNGKGRGGRQLRIAFESLSSDAQSRYRGEQEQEAADVRLSLTGAQREKLDFKQMVVLDYQDFKATYPKADKRAAFLQQYNQQHPDKPLTKRQLNHWETQYKRDGLAGLVDRRGGYNKGASTIPEDVKQVFLAYWMQEKGNRRGGGPSIASCYRLTQLNFPDRQLPSVAAFQRFVQTIPYAAKVLGREGKKAFADKCEPYIPFDYRSICTNEIWCADNHVFDLWTKDEKGRIFRPWIIGWMDKRSRYIVGYQLLDHDPNADSVLDAFARSVNACGIPERVLLDNGADYTTHDLFNKNFALSLANEMSIAVTNATPYNAKAKLIERFFNTLEYTYCIHLSSYFGPDPQRRPERLKKASEQLKEEAIPFQEFSEHIAFVIDSYNNTPHSGEAMDGMSPCQAFRKFTDKPINTATSSMLAMYFKRTTRLLTVGRNGVRVPELQMYFDSEQLIPYQKKKIYVRYNTDDVREVYCFSEEDEFICTARSVALGNLSQEMTAQNMRELNNKKKQLRRLAKQHIPDIAVPSTQQLAMASGKYFDKPDLKVLPSVIQFDGEKQRKAEVIQNAEQQPHIQTENQRDEDEALYKFMTGG